MSHKDVGKLTCIWKPSLRGGLITGQEEFFC